MPELYLKCFTEPLEEKQAHSTTDPLLYLEMLFYKCIHFFHSQHAWSVDGRKEASEFNSVYLYNTNSQHISSQVYLYSAFQQQGTQGAVHKEKHYNYTENQTTEVI
ncbi:hypothetical protein ATANTOWER_008934 [Ataeniobius toweri]|uniref:Uncharacterized protein n=1 Tax=Ataeniobius toweri TaxID=208326 RepID=A0ABU7BHY1_9TELE|nr:hypothetical protein [Ataeniobius toweri]